MLTSEYYDECRICKIVTARMDMRRAEKVLGNKARGWVCGPCETRRAQRSIAALIDHENKRRGLA